MNNLIYKFIFTVIGTICLWLAKLFYFILVFEVKTSDRDEVDKRVILLREKYAFKTEIDRLQKQIRDLKGRSR